MVTNQRLKLWRRDRCSGNRTGPSGQTLAISSVDEGSALTCFCSEKRNNNANYCRCILTAEQILTSGERQIGAEPFHYYRYPPVFKNSWK